MSFTSTADLRAAPVMTLRGGLRVRIAKRLFGRLPATLRGAIAMLLAMAAFSCGDAIMKLLAADLGLGGSLLARGAAAMVMLGVMLAQSDEIYKVRSIANGLVALRTAADVGSSLFFVGALGLIPLADAASILQATPLVITAGAALFLGEPVGWRRWSATIIGLVGALLIIQPGSASFNWGSMLALLTVLTAASRDIISRHVKNFPVILMTALAVAATTLVSIPLAFVSGWRPLTTMHVLLAFGGAAFMVAGQILTVLSVRTAPMAAVVPFRYSAMIWTLLLSAAIWHYIPNTLTLIGVAIVCGAGLYTIFREQALRKQGRLP